ncbi:hypothetical protein [Clostridium sp. YIM B02500]|uniref:hypothetical protein n=1 Tax=Clostridium sp. YIM B02500 TaxID=2910681 RepID=UPI001EEDBCF8|nr:hypothetical protein [Clostridium sp. YIM B02500]
MILAASLLILLGQTPNIVFAATSPNISSSAYNSENIFTQSGYKGQCTWFVWGRAYEKLGIKLNSQFYAMQNNGGMKLLIRKGKHQPLIL